MHHRLLADAINERLPGDLVIRFQNVMNLQNDMVVVAHRTGVDRLLETDDHAVATVVECALLKPTNDFAMATITTLVYVHRLQYPSKRHLPLLQSFVEVMI